MNLRDDAGVDVLEHGPYYKLVDGEAVEISFDSTGVLKHGSHNQKDHAGKKGGAKEESSPTRTRTVSGDELDAALRDYEGNVLISAYSNAGDRKAVVCERLEERLSDVSTQDLLDAAYGRVGDPDTPYGYGSPQRNADYALRGVTEASRDLRPRTADYVYLQDGQLAFTEDGEGYEFDGLGRMAAPVGTREAEQYVRQSAVSQLVTQWAASSNDENITSLAIQDAAAREFGVTGATAWSMRPEVRQKLQAKTEQSGPVLQKFVRAQYDETQAMFDSLGIQEIVVYRGQKVGAFSDLSIAGEEGQGVGGVRAEAQTRPVSSWSSDPRTAAQFAWESTGGDGVWDDRSVPIVMRSTVPTRKILSTPLTGVGCSEEKEIVTVGAFFDVDVVAIQSKYDRGGFDD